MAIEDPEPEPEIKRRLVPALVFAVLVVLMMLWLTGRFERKVAAEPASAPGRSAEGVTLVEVQRLAAPAVEAVVGTIGPVWESEVASRVLARVVAVKIEAGQSVSAGETLVRLDDADLRARREQAVAAHAAALAEEEQARRDLARGETLHARGAMTEVDWERCQVRARTATAELERTSQAASEAAANLSFTAVAAPRAGVVIDKRVDVGDIVRPGEPLFALYDPSRMQIVGSVREALAGQLKVGQAVEIELTSVGESCPAEVTEIVPAADAASRSFAVKAVGNCGPRAVKGMFGRLLVPLASEERLLVPRASVVRVGQLDLVDVAEGGELVRRIVQLGRRSADGTTVEVLSGLAAGEQIAATPGTAPTADE